MPRRGSGERGVPRARARSSSALPEATCQLGRERRGRELLSKLRSRNVQTRRWRGGGSPRSVGVRAALAVLSLLESWIQSRSLLSSSLFLASQCALLLIFSPGEISKAKPRPAPEFATKLRVTEFPLRCWSVGTGSLSLGRFKGLQVPPAALL